MQCLSFAVALGLLWGTWAQINVVHPECDSPEAEGAALVAQDYLNAQHSHGYKYALNRIEDIKIITKPGGDLYVMEIELLQTDCHVFDPTPIINCTVRPKALTAVEGDCDVVLKNISGALTVTAFKCKTEESREDLCLGCPTLLPLNDTKALDFVLASLGTFNNMTENVTFSLLEVGRMSSQNVLGRPIYLAEYIVTEASCTGSVCEPLNDAMAVRGICSAKGLNSEHSIDCKMFPNLISVVDNSTSLGTPAVHAHSGNLSTVYGLRHHKLTALHDPFTLLSAESAESVEVVPVAPAAASETPAAASETPAAASETPAAASETPAAASETPASSADLTQAEVATDSNSRELFKRDLAAVESNSSVTHDSPVLMVPVCPGRIRFFD
ncbi:unnamed protein product [Knipowitschia caucasica]